MASELAAALVKVQAELKPIVRNAEGQVGNKKRKYADLAAVSAVVLPLLAKHGLAEQVEIEPYPRRPGTGRCAQSRQERAPVRLKPGSLSAWLQPGAAMWTQRAPRDDTHSAVSVSRCRRS